MSEDTFSLSQVQDGAQRAVNRFREFLGVEFEAHVCPGCNAACEATRAYDRHTAPEHGGETPAWECPECGAVYRRGQGVQERMTGDMYGRE